MKHSTSTNLRPREGLGLIRFLMVLGSMAPLFIFLAIRGVPVIDGQPLTPDSWFVTMCLLLIGMPTGIIALRIYIAGKNQDTKELVIGSATDHRDHIIAYLFAMVIPLYQNNYASIRDIAAALAVLVFILFLFTYMNMHYMNLLFALAGYRVYTVETDSQGNPISGQCPMILLSKRHSLHAQQRITVRRISDTVFIEYEK